MLFSPLNLKRLVHIKCVVQILLFFTYERIILCAQMFYLHVCPCNTCVPYSIEAEVGLRFSGTGVAGNPAGKGWGSSSGTYSGRAAGALYCGAASPTLLTLFMLL